VFHPLDGLAVEHLLDRGAPACLHRCLNAGPMPPTKEAPAMQAHASVAASVGNVPVHVRAQRHYRLPDPWPWRRLFGSVDDVLDDPVVEELLSLFIWPLLLLLDPLLSVVPGPVLDPALLPFVEPVEPEVPLSLEPMPDVEPLLFPLPLLSCDCDVALPFVLFDESLLVLFDESLP
jgi:hypothetical protein